MASAWLNRSGPWHRTGGRPSQTKRALALLRERAAEGRGLNPTDLLPPVANGRPPVTRMAARIDELRAAGFSIVSRREANRTATYYLVSEPRPPLLPSDEPALQGRLFSAAGLLRHDREAV